jgi:hypothetical protein
VGIVFKNNAKTTLSSGVNNSTTTIPVTEGSVFPAVDLSGSGTFFLMTLDDDTNNEIVKVTTCSGNSGNIDLTVVRAQESTTARAFSSGIKAELRFTSGTIDHIRSDNTVNTNIFTTANSSTTAFTLSQAVTDENDLVVFIDGVFQAHNTYTVSGTTLTLATAPASGRVVTAYSIKGLRSATNVAIATMTGDNSDTTLTLPIEPINENSVQVFFDGVYQNKSNFSISGTTLTFSTAPPTNVAVEAIMFTQTNIDTAAILKDADGDTKVQVEESSDEDKIRFDTGGTERAIIDSTGLGIGTSSPSAPLTVSTTGSGDAVIIESTEAGSSNAPDLVLHRNSASPADDDSLGIIRFRGENDASEAIDLINIFGQVTDVSDGSEDSTLYFKTYTDGAEQSPLTLVGANVGIGTTSPNALLHIKTSDPATNQAVIDFRNPTYGIFAQTNSISSRGNTLEFIASDYNSNNATTHNVLTMRPEGNVGIGTTSPSKLLHIKSSDPVIRLEDSSPSAYAEIDGAGGDLIISCDAGDNDADSVIQFKVDNSEKMRINSSGNVGIGTTSYTEKLQVKGAIGFEASNSTNRWGVYTYTDNTFRLNYNGAGADEFLISSSGIIQSSPTYAQTTSNSANMVVRSSGDFERSTSSRRYKNTITDATKGLEELKALRPVNYKGNNDGETVFYGLIAEEVHDAGFTEFVEYNNENEPDALRYPHMVALCIKAIQEQQTLIETLQAKVEALENG